MYKKGIVVKIENEEVTILPFVKDACASCSHNCSEHASCEPYTAANPHALPIKEGTVVGVSAEKKSRGRAGNHIPFVPIPVCRSRICPFRKNSRLSWNDCNRRIQGLVHANLPLRIRTNSSGSNKDFSAFGTKSNRRSVLKF